MSLSVNYNPSVLTIQSNLSSAYNSLTIALNRMSTGYRINSAKDDAAGLYVATNLNTQIRGLKQAQKNVNDAISLVNTADGSLANMTNILYRLRDLATQSANGIYDESSRNAMQAEADALTKELYRIKNSTTFNGLNILGELENQINNIAMNLGVENVSAVFTDTVPSGYIGIYSAEDLNNIRNNLSANYILMNDIDLSSFSNWNPIGEYVSDADGNPDPTKIFSGILDGNGHTIRNLKIDSTGTGGTGLIGLGAATSEIKNLIVDGATIKAIGGVGTIVGGTEGKISNCYAININITAENYFAGGIVGMSYGTIESCYTSGTINSTGYYTGGIAGQSVEILNCSSTININGSYGSGGIVGNSIGNITSCSSTGNIISDSNLSGGIAGIHTQGVIQDCYSTGKVEGLIGVGGIAGGTNSGVSNCYATGATKGNSSVGGIVGSLEANGVAIHNNFNKDTTGLTNAIGYMNNSVENNNNALTTDQMQVMSNWDGWDTSIWDFTTIPPTLKNTPPAIITPTPTPPATPDGGGNYRLQIGADASDSSFITFDSEFSLGNFSVDFTNAETSKNSIKTVDEMLNLISQKRSEFGAILNRLDSVIQSQITAIENYTAAKSTIMDADIAQESANYVKNQILQQTSASLLVQAQQTHSGLIINLIK